MSLTMRQFTQGLRLVNGRVAKVRASESEHYIQASYFSMLHHNVEVVPEFDWIFAIPNAGAGAQSGQAGKMRAEGVRPGVPDVCVPFARADVHGLYIEFKSENGRLSDEQKAYRAQLESENYAWHLARTALDAYTCTVLYLDIGHTQLGRMRLPLDWQAALYEARNALEAARQREGIPA